MVTNKYNCEVCIHNTICKYIDDIEEVSDTVDNALTDVDVPTTVNVNVTCDMYKTKYSVTCI